MDQFDTGPEDSGDVAEPNGMPKDEGKKCVKRRESEEKRRSGQVSFAE
jgi:hypothetical protein